MGRPKGINYPIRKGIRLTEEQAENWDSEAIKEFLDSGYILLRRLYALMVEKMKPARSLEPEDRETIKLVMEVVQND